MNSTEYRHGGLLSAIHGETAGHYRAEVPVQCGDHEFFVDLLFYHCRLHRYVVFELKLGRFEPGYVGKLNFYVQLIDDKLPDLGCR